MLRNYVFKELEYTCLFDIQRTCIVIYSYNKTNEMHQFLKFIFGIELYMFRTVSLSIIRSVALASKQST